MKRGVRELSLVGSYRKIMGKATDIEWQTMAYDDFKLPLTLTDFEKFLNTPEPTSIQGGKLRALKLSFTLSTSSYATMLFRELLKQTSEVTRQQIVESEPRPSNNQEE
jgi:tRNA pseudouridine13 synthase